MPAFRSNSPISICYALKSRFTVFSALTKRENLILVALSNIKGALEDATQPTFSISFLQQWHFCGPALSLRSQTKCKKRSDVSDDDGRLN